MYPHERSLVKTYAGRPFSIVGVNSDKSAAELRAVMKEKDLPWISFFDGGGPPGSPHDVTSRSSAFARR